MQEKGKRAEALFCDGYNCAQAVFLTFCEDYGIDKATGARLANCMGGGFSRTGGLCGAVSAGGMALSAKFGREEPGETARQDKTYRSVKEFHHAFKEEFGDVTCPALMKAGMERSGDERNPKFLCPAYVRRAAELVELYLAGEE